MNVELPDDPNVLVIMPCFKDGSCLKRLVPEILAVNPRYRILVVNDTGMPDPELDELSQEYKVEVFTVPYNMGHQAAIVYGIICFLLHASYDDVDFVVTMDSDGQDDPSVIPDMIQKAGLTKICVAQRTGDRPEGLKFSIGYAIHKSLFKLGVGFVPDYGNYAVMSRGIARQVAVSPEFDTVYSMSLHSLAPLEKLELKRRARYDGTSRVRFEGLIDHALSAILANLKTIAKRLAFASLIISGFLFALSLLIAIAKFVLPAAYVAPNWATTICFGSAILGIQFFSLCVLLFVMAAGIRQSSHSQRLIMRMVFAEAKQSERGSTPQDGITEIITRLK